MKNNTNLSFKQIQFLTKLATGFTSGQDVKISTGYDYSNGDDVINFYSTGEHPSITLNISQEKTRCLVKIGNRTNKDGDYSEDYMLWERLADASFDSVEELEQVAIQWIKQKMPCRLEVIDTAQ